MNEGSEVEWRERGDEGVDRLKEEKVVNEVFEGAYNACIKYEDAVELQNGFTRLQILHQFIHI